MNKLRWLLVAGGVVLVAGLYLFGRTASVPAGNSPQLNEMGGHAMPTHAIQFDEVKTRVGNFLPSSRLDSLKILDDKLSNASNKENAQRALVNFWSRNDMYTMAGKYLMDIASREQTKKAWVAAGDTFQIGFQQSNDSIIRNFAIQEAIDCYKNAIEKDTADLNNQVKLAQCYVDGSGDVMSGVLLLKKVEQKDPDNIEMNLLLGRLDIQSGQLDMAVVRLEKLVKAHPSEADAWFYLGTAYKATGKNDKALQSFEKFRSMISDPDELKQIDNIIKQLKNS